MEGKILTKKDFISAFGVYDKSKCRNINTGKIYRFAREDDYFVFIYYPRRQRYGRRYRIEDFLNTFEPIIVTKEDLDKTWHKKVKKVIKCLEESGLWPDLKTRYENLYLMSLEDKINISNLYWSRHDAGQTVENYNKEMQEWINKYPFIQDFCDNKFDRSGYLNINTFYIWEKSDAKTKSMYFGKYDNARIKEEFKNALQNKTSYSSGRIRVNYDVTLEYDADKNMAWYSEEYKNCGNGHYYLAIGPTTALFCEDD